MNSGSISVIDLRVGVGVCLSSDDTFWLSLLTWDVFQAGRGLTLLAALRWVLTAAAAEEGKY